MIYAVGNAIGLQLGTGNYFQTVTSV